MPAAETAGGNIGSRRRFITVLMFGFLSPPTSAWNTDRTRDAGKENPAATWQETFYFVRFKAK